MFSAIWLISENTINQKLVRLSLMPCSLKENKNVDGYSIKSGTDDW